MNALNVCARESCGVALSPQHASEGADIHASGGGHRANLRTSSFAAISDVSWLTKAKMDCFTRFLFGNLVTNLFKVIVIRVANMVVNQLKRDHRMFHKAQDGLFY